VTSGTVNISVNATDNAGGSGVKEVRFSAMGRRMARDRNRQRRALFHRMGHVQWSAQQARRTGMEVHDNAGNVFIWSRDGGANPHIPKNYVCTGTGDPTAGGAWEVWGWQNEYLAGSPNAHEYWTWDNGNYPYVYSNWGSGGPFGWGGDNFSMRFQRNVNFQGGDYDFYADHDDGTKVWIDGQLIIDVWWGGHNGGSTGRYVSPGSHEIKIEYFETLGDAFVNVWWYGPGYPRPDNNAPTGRITSPSNQSATNDTTLDIWVEASDDASGVSQVEIFAWHCQPTCDWHELGTDTSAPYVYAWDWSSLQDAHVWLSVHISDNTGKESIDPGGWVEVDLDRGAPTAAIDGPAEGSFLTSSQVGVQAAASDSRSGVGAVQFFAGYTALDDASVQGQPEPPQPGSWTAESEGASASDLTGQDYWHEIDWDEDGTDGWSLTWDASAVPDQAGVSFYVYVYDKAGNYQGAPSWGNVLDRAAPSSTVASLPPASPATFTVSWSGSDATSGIGSYDVQIQQDGGGWSYWLTGLATTSGAYSGQVGHTYAFRVRAYDGAGNVEAWPDAPDTQTTTVAPPANDGFGAATLVSTLPFIASLDTRGATSAADDPTSSCGGMRHSNGSGTDSTFVNGAQEATGSITHGSGLAGRAATSSVAARRHQRYLQSWLGAVQSNALYVEVMDWFTERGFPQPPYRPRPQRSQ
jgi:hypothetical protein